MRERARFNHFQSFSLSFSWYCDMRNVVTNGLPVAGSPGKAKFWAWHPFHKLDKSEGLNILSKRSLSYLHDFLSVLGWEVVVSSSQSTSTWQNMQFFTLLFLFWRRGPSQKVTFCRCLYFSWFRSHSSIQLTPWTVKFSFIPFTGNFPNK